MFAGENIQLLPQDQDLEIFVVTGYAGDTEEVDEDGTQLCQKGDEHGAIVMAGSAGDKISEVSMSERHCFRRQIASAGVFTGHGRFWRGNPPNADHHELSPAFRATTRIGNMKSCTVRLIPKQRIPFKV